MARVAIAGLMAIGLTVAARAASSLDDIVRRMAAYVDAYGDRASIVVATERYEQSAVNTRLHNSDRRTLLSEFAIVRTADRRWVGFRDVLEVDGRRVEDREDRLAALLTSGGLEEARRITEESARFNLGSMVRDFNVPSAVLFFFTPDNLDRFRFKATSAATDGLRQVAFQETHTPTLIRTPQGESIRSAGSLWVRPEDGAIVRTLLDFHVNNRGLAELVDLSVSVDVKYARVEALAMWLPAVMTERYEGRQGTDTDSITTRADYSNYRTFQTSVRIK